MVLQNFSLSGSSAYKAKQWCRSIAAALVCIVLIVFFHHNFNSGIVATHRSAAAELPLEPSNSSATANLSPFKVKSDAAQYASVAELVTHSLPVNIAALVAAGNYQRANGLLLEQTLMAVERSDDRALATALSHLGEIALLQGNMETAEIYLVEAVDFFNQLNDEIAAAGVYMQLGQLHLVARQRARLASRAYDTLLIGRWKITNGQFDTIEEELQSAANSNLSLNRYGAAASVYETLFKGYSSQGNYQQARQAGSEAAKIFAASGRDHDARQMLEKMRQHGFAESVITELQTEIHVLELEYRDSERTIAAAKDHALLYNQLQARGDVVNAWRFRQQADRLLAGASARAQYRRQSDVLVELHKSNFSMENAKASLQQAKEVYLRHGMDIQMVKNLQSKIF